MPPPSGRRRCPRRAKNVPSSDGDSIRDNSTSMEKELRIGYLNAQIEKGIREPCYK